MARSGFTLIEMVIAIAVMSILGLLAFYAMGTARETQKLDSAQEKLVSDLRTAQNDAIAGKTYPPKVGTDNLPQVVKTTTVKFVNDKSNLYYIQAYDNSNSSIESSVQTIAFPDGVYIDDPIINNVQVNGDIVFCFVTPISGDGYFCNQQWSQCGSDSPCLGGSKTIVLKNRNLPSSVSRSVVVQGNGISVERAYAQ